MFLVGLTGAIASGKSTVAGMLERRGCVVIDADKAARQVVEPGTRANTAIRKAFGSRVFNSDGTLDRQLLGRIIFSDEPNRRILNSIVHPEVRRHMIWQALTCLLRGHHFVVLDVPLLFETETLLPFLSEIVVVYCRPETQMSRLLARSGDALSAPEATARVQSQMSLERKKALASHAHCLIDNEGSLEETEAQVAALVAHLRLSRRHLVFRAVALAVLSLLVALPVAAIAAM